MVLTTTHIHLKAKDGTIGIDHARRTLISNGDKFFGGEVGGVEIYPSTGTAEMPYRYLGVPMGPPSRLYRRRNAWADCGKKVKVSDALPKFYPGRYLRKT